jgi:hypothetical protein
MRRQIRSLDQAGEAAAACGVPPRPGWLAGKAEKDVRRSREMGGGVARKPTVWERSGGHRTVGIGRRKGHAG